MAEDKVQIVKNMAINGQFSACESKYGAKAALKAKEYAKTKLNAFRDSLTKSPDSIAPTKFLAMAVTCPLDMDIVDIADQFSCREDESGTTITTSEIGKEKKCREADVLLQNGSTAVITEKLATPLVEVDALAGPQIPTLDISSTISPPQAQIATTTSPIDAGTTVMDAILKSTSAPELPKKTKKKFVMDTSQKENMSKEGNAMSSVSKPKKQKSENGKKQKERKERKEGKENKDKQEKKTNSSKKRKSSKDDDEDVGSTIEVYKDRPVSSRQRRGTSGGSVNYCDDKKQLTCSEVVKARRRKAAPAPPVAMSVWQDNYRGIKQQDLTSEEDLLHADVFDLNTAQLPHDPVLNRTGPHVNAIFVLILQSYREFLSSLPCEITHGESVKDCQDICGNAAADRIKAHVVKRTLLPGDDELHVLELQAKDHGTIRILYAPACSSLLQTDPFLVLKSEMDASLKHRWIVETAQVRKVFQEPDGRIVYEEGSIYYVSPDIDTNPFRSISVIWLVQEKVTYKWVYAYNQQDNVCSPWELQLSQYVLAENMHAPKLPKSLRVGSLTPHAILSYILSVDYSSIFKIPILDNQEYCDMFEENDRLDLHIITKLCQQGRYDDPNGVGVAVLFNDLDRMINNGKLFNACNNKHLPWRLADALEKCMLSLRRCLGGLHKEVLKVAMHWDVTTSSSAGPSNGSDDVPSSQMTLYNSQEC